jgi:hypothetical protein
MLRLRFANELAALQKKPITSEEFASLKEVGNGFRRRPIPVEHRRRLLEVGYIREVPTGEGEPSLALTGAGLKRLVTGRWWMANDRSMRRPV